MAEDEARGKTRESRNAARQTEGVREIDVADLMPNAREAVILYNGERYRLRITSNDKLILTK